MVQVTRSHGAAGLLLLGGLLIATGNSGSKCTLSSVSDAQSEDIVSPVGDVGAGPEEIALPGEIVDAVEGPGEEKPALCVVKAVHPVTCQCITKPKCSDGKYWTKDTCDPQTGECSFAPDSYLCPGSGTCDDGNACTQDCDDPLTGQCVHLAKSCDDSDSCTDDWCDIATGECIHEGSGGLFDVCGNFLGSCWESVCDPVHMTCSTTPKCDDGNDCTTDTCDEATGGCTFEPGPSCEPCGEDADCDDGVPCTLDSCVANLWICSHLESSCDDGNCLTDDWCDAATGQCVNQPKPADWCENK